MTSSELHRVEVVTRITFESQIISFICGTAAAATLFGE